MITTTFRTFSADGASVISATEKSKILIHLRMAIQAGLSNWQSQEKHRAAVPIRSAATTQLTAHGACEAIG